MYCKSYDVEIKKIHEEIHLALADVNRRCLPSFFVKRTLDEIVPEVRSSMHVLLDESEDYSSEVGAILTGDLRDVVEDDAFFGRRVDNVESMSSALMIKMPALAYEVRSFAKATHD